MTTRVLTQIRTFLGQLWRDDVTGLSELDEAFLRTDMLDLVKGLGRSCRTARGAVTVVLGTDGEISIASAGLNSLEVQALVRKATAIVEGEKND